MARLQRAATSLGLALVAIGSHSALAQAGGADELRPALLDVTVNGQRTAEPALFLRGEDGALYAAASMFAQWRMRLPAGSPIVHEGDSYYRLDTLSGFRLRVVEETQAVAIDAPPEAFRLQQTSLGHREEMAMTPAGTGAFVNYDLVVEHARGETVAGGAFELGLFTPRGVAQSAFVASTAPGADPLVRLDTSWAIDRPGNATSLRIGDSVSSAGPGVAPVRFAGIHYFRNHAVRPGFLTMPLVQASGGAAVPSVVDVYVNNVLQASREVAPGPFALADIPVQSGGGTVQLVVRDLLGRETVFEQSYYASSQLLRRGLHDFSYEAGFIRRGFGRSSFDYGDFMASTTHRYGISDRLTGEVHAQASRSVQNGGIAFTLLAFDLGQAGASASVSRSDRGTGYRLAASFERRTPGLSFGLLSDYSSADYRFLGLPGDYRPPRLTLQAYGDLPLARGSIGANLLHRELRDGPAETLAGLTGSWQLGPAAMVQLYARRSVAGARNAAVGAHLAFALGGRRSASAGVEHGSRGTVANLAYQDDPPVGPGGGFRASASFGRFDRAEAAYVHNLPMATLGAQLAHARGTTGLRLSAAGSLGLVGGGLFAARSLGESFAAVRVDGYPGVRVYADDRLVGVTGAGGSLTVPGLRAFEANRIRIDEADLPLEAQIDVVEQTIRPFARAGAVLRFAVRAERGVLMRVRREDGSALPAGATVGVEGDEASYVVVGDGEVYVPGLSGRRKLHARWNGGRCGFTADVPATDDPQPYLDGLVCRGEEAYASN